MPAAKDRDFTLQRLAAENGRWADEELRLIETIRENKRRLAELPTIIRKLRGELEHATAEMNRTGREHDALEAETDDDFYVFVTGYTGLAGDAEFHAWADDMADDYADHKLAVQPPVGW